ncbi:cap-specific mRNA (nucleoside-2'-O-)-methyltransferase 2 [Galleria mellonella]|uniref:Cap-specific mRNA (nucleoside-2'-O-)-methyltransferase 2 n=1 Tax=Galleria mellonella TaxID=7137 RepID=A0A6J1X916_GALME|nr:cap-specific mRNA (nucleoside-2'-O-)-methyltransferase 2 [Galleria mellonella]
MDKDLPRLKLFRDGEFDVEINELFNKKFSFRFNNSWKLPDCKLWFSTPPWKVKDLEVLKSRLNFHKSQLNDFNIEEWSSHTRRRNPAGEVGWKIRCIVNPEFLTQAWTKFYECASTYNIIPKEVMTAKKFVSLHLCEAPGAFITSLNHYLKLNYPEIEWKWVANTLNPYYEGNSPSNMISDDRFMFHTLDNWDFGVDNTGNLMDWDNSQATIKKAVSLGNVLLVTADGSIDCMQRPDAQEEVTSPLHYCEIITALQALSSGGTFIFKLFTLFEHSTVNLLYLINHLFEEVNIYKPVTSRQGNSEVYAVCINYKGSAYLEKFISILRTAYGTEKYSSMALFPLEEIPDSYLKQVHECAHYFCVLQCQVINNNLQAYLMQNNISLHRDMKRVRALVATEFIWRYGVKPLDAVHEILKGALHEECKTNMNPRYHRGSYTERQLYTKMSIKEKSKTINSLLQAEIMSNPSIIINDPVKWSQSCNEETRLKLVFTYGRPLQKINSSKFIFVPIFRLYQQILAEDEFKEILFSKDFKEYKNNHKDLGIEIDKVLDLPEFDYSESYSVYEKNCFFRLHNALKELSLGQTLLIKNLNTLTHFNVSFLFIVSKSFEKTGFMPSGIILCTLMNKHAMTYLDVIENECVKLQNEDARDLLNSLPVQTTNVGVFFDNIVLYNNTFYRNKCTEYLYTIERSL